MKKKIMVLGGFLLSFLVLAGCGRSANNNLNFQSEETGQEKEADQEQEKINNERKNEGQEKNTKRGRNGEPGQGMGGSTEAVSACEGKTENDSCEFTFAMPNGEGEKTLTGTCQNGPQKDENVQLSCRPQMRVGANGESEKSAIQQ